MTSAISPVAVFRHSPGEGPGYFATFLDAHLIPWQLIRIDESDPIPAMVESFSGLCFMGGPMSVNDDLAWIPSVLKLIREAAQKNMPVIGHCLGGQLMAKALGGVVSLNPVKEIGWGNVQSTEMPCSDWLGDTKTFEAFHWHGETFSLPPGATRILKSEYCENQAYVLGNSLGMQCHVEMTEAMIRLWSRHWADENAAPGPSVLTPQQINENVGARIAAMRIVADRLYERWIKGLKQ